MASRLEFGRRGSIFQLRARFSTPKQNKNNVNDERRDFGRQSLYPRNKTGWHTNTFLAIENDKPAVPNRLQTHKKSMYCAVLYLHTLDQKMKNKQKPAKTQHTITETHICWVSLQPDITLPLLLLLLLLPNPNPHFPAPNRLSEGASGGGDPAGRPLDPSTSSPTATWNTSEVWGRARTRSGSAASVVCPCEAWPNSNSIDYCSTIITCFNIMIVIIL